MREVLQQQQAKGGAGLRILTESITSPTLADQTARYPDGPARCEVAPVGTGRCRTPPAQEPQLAFGQPVNTYYDFSKADVIVSLDCDFLASGPGSLRYARQFAANGGCAAARPSMNRLYVLEPMPTPTGAKADHRLPLRAGRYRGVRLGSWPPRGRGTAATRPKSQNPNFYKWIGPLARDLQAHSGAASVVWPATYQPAAVHALAHAMNQALGNVGQTVFYTDPVEANPVDQLASLQDLVKDLDAGAVDVLLILGGNPVFNAPVELGMRDRMQKAQLRIHLGLYEDETSEVCQWHLPETHFLETWSDARAFDGTATIMQPLIQPLYGGRSAHEVLHDAHRRRRRSSGYEIVKGYWSAGSTRARISRRGGASGARWRGAGHGAAARKTPDATGAAGRTQPATPKQGAGNRLPARSRPSTTAASPTTAGCRNCPSRSPSSPGTTPPS